MKTVKNTSSPSWKQRYQDLLEQQDRQQTRYKRKQLSLKNSVIHLIHFSRDLDAEADKKLLAMRGIVRQDSIKNVDLALVVESLEFQIEKSLKDRKTQQNRIAQQMSMLAKQVQGLVQYRKLQQELSELKKAIAAKPLKLANVAGYLGNLSDIHALALKQFKPSKGILQRLFGANDAVQNQTSTTAHEETLDAALIVSELNQARSDGEHPLSLETIAGYLQRLLQQLNLQRTRKTPLI